MTTSVLPVVVGVDIGGTNTDAVLLHHEHGEHKVISEVKELTTDDVIDGVRRAVLRCLLQAKEKGFLVAPVQVNIGTTHFINAVVQQKDLARVSVIRICGPVSQELPPFCDFPSRLAAVVRGSVHLVKGGYKYDGTEKEAFDEDEFRNVVREIKENGIANIAVIGIFASVRQSQELRARDIVLEMYPEATVSLSHRIGDLGLIQRENATILNECLKPLCIKTIERFEEAFEDVGVHSPLFLTQNDGTVITRNDVLQFPVRTFASGSTNSMQGAAFLSSKKDAIVVDIGGTTCDVGLLRSGFAREASMGIKVAGVKTNFRMPDVISIGLGGGSYVTENRNQDGDLIDVEVGPYSAGFNLKNEALVYSETENVEGRTLTATDIAVFSGLCNLGSKEKVSNLDANLVSKAMDKIHSMLEDLVDKIKLKQEELPVIIVGGGSVLVDTKRRFKGASELIIPQHFGVANAIGAALSKVSTSVDTMINIMDMVDVKLMDAAVKEARENEDFSCEHDVKICIENAKKPFIARAREQAFETIYKQAKLDLLHFGAKEDSIEILEKSDSSLSYIPGKVLNIKMKVVGDMRQPEVTERSVNHWEKPEGSDKFLQKLELPGCMKQTITSTGLLICKDISRDDEDATQVPKDPFVDEKSGEWILSDWDIECLAVGSGIYGCGGGGSVHIGKIRALKAVRDGKKIRVIRNKQLVENSDPDKDLVFAVGMIGSPNVAYETGSATVESKEAVKCLKNIYDIGGFKDGSLQNGDGVKIEETPEGCRFVTNYNPIPFEKPEEYNIVGLTSFEFAGVNAMEPLLLAADMGIPVIDADGMSRAFPQLEMYIPFMYGKPPYPLSIIGCGELSEKSVLLYAPDGKQAENFLRDVSIKHGCLAHLALTLTTSEIDTKTAHYVISSAWRLGDAVLRARLEKKPVIETIVEQENGKHVITGKVSDVQRETSSGFNKGNVLIEGIDTWAGQKIEIEFQNEYLVVFPLKDGKRGAHQGCVPDLIGVVDSDTGEPITAEELRYGMVVGVVLLPSCDMLRRPEALRWIAPHAFRYNEMVSFVPYKERKRVQPIPVIP